MEIINQEIMLKILQLIEDKKVNVKNAVELVQAIMKQVSMINGLPTVDQKAMVISIIKDIAKGADGIENTEDDLIPSNVVAGAKALIDNSLVGSVFDLIQRGNKEGGNVIENVPFLSCFGKCLH